MFRRLPHSSAWCKSRKCAVGAREKDAQERWNDSVAATREKKRVEKKKRGNYNMAARHADGVLNMR